MFSLFLFAALASASVVPKGFKRQASGGYTGVATFNDFVAQGTVACGSLAVPGGTFGAALFDASPDIAPKNAICPPNPANPQLPPLCSGEGPVSGYQPPLCNTSAYCGGICFTVTNTGAIGGTPGATGTTGTSITVKIIDVCPLNHAQNTCKTSVEANQRCQDTSTNALDIDEAAYSTLTGGIAFADGVSSMYQ